ncbi:hypothetical protein HPB47_004559 [Ixodes persulcatus]|uniref:Uncharacterized protein n=1 Tax=Ixodes persulcatus TaxID=34615 RepID=A0AC60PFC4_IXOPE|nr:hypothetical protein HPB47_004559 [Ixodes persulcatus]
MLMTTQEQCCQPQERFRFVGPGALRPDRRQDGSARPADHIPSHQPFLVLGQRPKPGRQDFFLYLQAGMSKTFMQTSFATTTNYLRRRFSSGDLSGELEDQEGATPGGGGGVDGGPRGGPEGVAAPQGSVDAGGDLSLNLRPSSATSAPSSPARTVTSFLSRGASLTSGATKNLPYAKDRHLTLLVVDDARTDWAKYFQGRKLHGNWDVRVEQAEFGDLTLWANTESGTTVSMGAVRQGTKVVRSFRPDFVLVRQHVRDAGRDYRPLLLGLHFGGVRTVNSLHSLYNFQDKPWVFTQLQSLQRRLGRENFPLVEQSFFPNHTEMLTANKFPCVVKVGHAHGGLGKMKVENNQDFQEVASVVALTGSYCVVEPLVDTRCDLHVQKIGTSYKAFVCVRAPLGRLLQVPMTERYKQWVDAVSELFGGLDICAVEAIQGKDGREYITEVMDSPCPLLTLGFPGENRFHSKVAIEWYTCGGGSIRVCFSVPGNDGRRAGVEEVTSRSHWLLRASVSTTATRWRCVSVPPARTRSATERRE